jgi:ADP-heptose:LPS heptosyltransferase
LGHLSAALSIPTLTLYGSTDPSLLAIEGNHHIQMQSPFHCVMCYQRTCSIPDIEESKPVCLSKILPKSVWSRLLSVMIRQVAKS